MIDASAAIELLLNTSLGERVATRLASGADTLHAPHLLDVEVLHAFRRLRAAGALAEALDATVVTCDGRLGRAHGHRADVEVVELPG